jgi:hypothetical protein
MASELERLGNNLVALLQAIPYLTTAQGGTILMAADPKPVLDFSNLTPPWALLIFDDENAAKNDVLGGAFQQSAMVWSIFVGAQSFSLAGEGTLGPVGVYQMIDDVIAAVDGKVISLVPIAKAFYVRCRRYNTLANAVIYQMAFRNAFSREQAAP